MRKTNTGLATRKNRTICLSFPHDSYNKIVLNPSEFRKYIDGVIASFPDLFPPEIKEGYRMKDSYYSKKMSIMIRRIKIAGTAYTIRPSFVTPYMTGLTDEVEKGLFLRKFNVPFWALSHVFGKNPMYWYRLGQNLGRNSIVGTTIRDGENIPEHLGADEKHTMNMGEKVYVATTVGNECILGASIAGDAGEQSLRKAYKVFKDEAQCLKPDYEPVTVNIDGWQATHNAWKFLFTSIVIICCFLHIFIKIRYRSKKKHKDAFTEAASKLWECYYSKSKRSFSQRVRRLVKWCRKKEIPSVISEPIEKLRNNIAAYSVAYDYPKAHRTSNMVDRLMQRMDRHLFSVQYFHGSMDSAELSIRGWALTQNFAPYNPWTVKKLGGFKSPAEQLNRFRYHDNWLHNLFISASLGGYRSPPQNTL